MLVYLDTNVYCRPMDDQTLQKIRSETEAFLKIQRLVFDDKVQLLGSDILRYEVTKITNVNKREEAHKNMVLCAFFIEEHKASLALAEDLEHACRLQGRDALHLASAVLGGAEYFLSCDDGIVKKSKRINTVLKKLNRKIAIANPTSFVYSFK